MNKRWTESDRLFIKENAAILTDDVAAAQLSNICGRHISVHAYRKQRQQLKIIKKPGRGICGVKKPKEEK